MKEIVLKHPPKEWVWPDSQAVVDARWLAIGNPGGVSPILPASMVGSRAFFFSSHSPDVKGLTPAGGKARKFTPEESKFWKVWYAVTIAPYQKQSAVSKVAGGLLQAAALVIPAAGIAASLNDTANAALALPKAKSTIRNVTELLTSAANQRALSTPASLEIPPAALDAVTGLPVSEFAPSLTAPISAPPVTSVSAPAQGQALRLSPRDVLIAGGVLTLIYLLWYRKR